MRDLIWGSKIQDIIVGDIIFEGGTGMTDFDGI